MATRSCLKLTITTTTTPYTKIARHVTTQTSSHHHHCGGWRITPCALLLSSHLAHVSSTPYNKNLLPLSPSFSTRNNRSSSSPLSFSTSPSNKLRISGSDPVTDPSSGPMVHSEDNNNTFKQPSSPPPHPPSMQQQSSSKFLTLPTVLTLGRVAAVPLLIATFYVDSWWGRTATTSIFVAAAITDWLDGYLARKMKLGSAFGAFLDPVADKLMVAATLVLLCTKPLMVPMVGQVPWILTIPAIAIIGREITMSAVREWAASQNAKLLEAVAVNNLGKWKTATQMIALTILLATRESSAVEPGLLVYSGIGLLYISAGLSVWSLAVYVGKIWKVLLK